MIERTTKSQKGVVATDKSETSQRRSNPIGAARRGPSLTSSRGGKLKKGRPAHDGRLLAAPSAGQQCLRALLILRRTPLTVTELAEEIGIRWRTAYHVLQDLRALGFPLERTPYGNDRRAAHYSIPAAPLRRLLLL